MFLSMLRIFKELFVLFFLKPHIAIRGIQGRIMVWKQFPNSGVCRDPDVSCSALQTGSRLLDATKKASPLNHNIYFDLLK